jgi:hypothetical protein
VQNRQVRNPRTAHRDGDPGCSQEDSQQTTVMVISLARSDLSHKKTGAAYLLQFTE